MKLALQIRLVFNAAANVASAREGVTFPKQICGRLESSSDRDGQMARQLAPRRLFSTAICLMDTDAYPGRDLSLLQLVFALNKELGRVAYSPLCVAKILPEPLLNVTLIPATALPWTQFLNSRVILRLHC